MVTIKNDCIFVFKAVNNVFLFYTAEIKSFQWVEKSDYQHIVGFG